MIVIEGLKKMPGAIEYLSLRKKTDKKEVYTATIDFLDSLVSCKAEWQKAMSRLQFYFDRVNSGIETQLASPKIDEATKKSLVKLDPADYEVALMTFWNEGGYFTRELWAKDFLEMKTMYCS